MGIIPFGENSNISHKTINYNFIEMKNYFLTAALACSFFSCSEDADVVTNELNESVD